MGLKITTEICSCPDCGGNIVIDEDGREYCLLCSRPELVLRITGKAKDVFGALGQLANKRGNETLSQIIRSGE